MQELESDLLRVNVPVGFLLAEPREIMVSIDRPTDTPLAIRLRLIPAQPPGDARPSERLPLRSRRRLSIWDPEDGYPLPDYGGGD